MYCPVFNAGLHIREYVDVRGACSPVQTQTNGCIGELAVTECPKDTRCKRGNVSRPRVENFINFRWRYAQGTHPFPSRTRWLRPGRPMVLYWRRYGRAGGCRNYKESIAGNCVDIYRYQPGAENAPEVSHLTLDFTGD